MLPRETQLKTKLAEGLGLNIPVISSDMDTVTEVRMAIAMALKEVSSSIEGVLTQLIGGIQSGMGYLGAANLHQLRAKARFIRVSPAGQREATPHDVVEVKAASREGLG